MLQAELKILGGKHQGRLIPLTSKKFLVGREQDCHLRPNSDLVSRHHCVFSIDEYAIRLRDLGSTNGTMVNGSNLRGEVILKSGDRVTIGKMEVEILIRQTAAKPAAPVAASPPLVAQPIPTQTPMEIPIPTDEVETSFDMAVFPVQPADPVAQDAPADTTIIGAGSPQYLQTPMPGYPQMMPPGYPMPSGFMPQPYPQYPQYPPGYGQPPGYGPPMGYPMGYPMMPMQGYPGVDVAPAVEEALEPDEPLAMRLPDPSETGVKPATPPAASASGAPAPKEEKPSTTAADIIKQYMNRRT